MGNVTKNFSLSGCNELYADLRNALTPFTKDTFIYAHRYVVDTDFASGDALVLEVVGAQKILFAVAKTPTNTLLTITEADMTTGVGKKLTLGTSTTDVEIFIIAGV